MSNEGKPFKLQGAVAERVLALAAPKRQFTQAQIEGVARWLEKELQGAIRRRDAKRLTMDDVRKLETAYLGFQNIIAKLQDRDDPPPELPSSESGSTVWDSWIGGNIAFGFPRGRGTSTDWCLVATLLAIYETVSKKRASASYIEGPTMKYLQQVQRLLAGVGFAYTPPKGEALHQQLLKLRMEEKNKERYDSHLIPYLRLNKNKLSEIISKIGE